MSAAQARLLSITARLTDNEMRSQLITNSKLRLADKSSEASSEYMKALNSSELTYVSYDSTGAKTTQSLTPSVLMNYSELKTQYGLINSSGQLMVSDIDRQNYENSDTLAEFLACYDVPLTDNPEYASAMTTLFGENYDQIMAGCTTDDDAATYIGNNVINGLFDGTANTWLNNYNSGLPTLGSGNITSTGYNNWVSQMSNGSTGWMDQYLNGHTYSIKGQLGDYLDTVSNPPSWDFGDEPVMPTLPNFGDLGAQYNSSRCFSSVGSSFNGNDWDTTAWHIEHNLCALIWGTDGFGTSTGSITSSSGITITKNDLDPSNTSITNTGVDTTSVVTNLLNALNGNSKYTSVQNVIQQLIDLYCDTVAYLTTNNTSNVISSKYSISPSGSVVANEQTYVTDLKSRWDNFYTSLTNLNGQINAEIMTEYTPAHDSWEQQYVAFQESVKAWKAEVELKQQTLLDAIANLPPQLTADENDPKYEWYKNLWYRMGGISETEKQDNSNSYKVLDSNLMNNAEWLQFALEHGIISLEQVTFSENGSDEYPNIGTVDWVSIQYNSVADISSEQNDAAIAKAEVKYQNALTEIEQQDKKYDQDLKKLDTEHSALQTEYDSIKSVIDKNVERSFKAFS